MMIRQRLNLGSEALPGDILYEETPEGTLLAGYALGAGQTGVECFIFSDYDPNHDVPLKCIRGLSERGKKEVQEVQAILGVEICPS